MLPCRELYVDSGGRQEAKGGIWGGKIRRCDAQEVRGSHDGGAKDATVPAAAHGKAQATAQPGVTSISVFELARRASVTWRKNRASWKQSRRIPQAFMSLRHVVGAGTLNGRDWSTSHGPACNEADMRLCALHNRPVCKVHEANIAWSHGRPVSQHLCHLFAAQTEG